MRKIKVSLCDLANDINGIDNKSIPIGVGYVASYCKKVHGDSIDINKKIESLNISNSASIVFHYINYLRKGINR